MHKFLRAIGFSDIKKKDLEMILDEIIECPEHMKVTKDSEGYEFAELSKSFGNHIGITIRGTYDEEDVFQVGYYYPYVEGGEISTNESVEIEKYAEKEAYAGICDELRLGVTLIFYLQNVADFLAEYRKNIHITSLRGVFLSALSVDGKIILPLEQKQFAKKVAYQKTKERNKLMAEAREGNEEAMENLTLDDMDIYDALSERILREDIYSIVFTSFMPYGIEGDQYSILGEILELYEHENTLTGEKIYRLKLNCNELIFDVTINEKDLLGEPAVGRRFKGSIWMQGTVCL
ncbi:MAG: DUF3881 family protein [Lachnospiraceae bacterium]|nr:DUF3881 family protein [Lachnospiraceae bacterium]